jgi:hypothetical protein
MGGIAHNKLNATRIGYDPYTLLQVSVSRHVCPAPGVLPISSSQLSSLSNPIKYAEIIDDQHHKPTLIIPNKHRVVMKLN